MQCNWCCWKRLFLMPADFHPHLISYLGWGLGAGYESGCQMGSVDFRRCLVRIDQKIYLGCRRSFLVFLSFTFRIGLTSLLRLVTDAFSPVGRQFTLPYHINCQLAPQIDSRFHITSVSSCLVVCTRGLQSLQKFQRLMLDSLLPSALRTKPCDRCLPSRRQQSFSRCSSS